MEEKYMVNDILENSKTEINHYTNAIISTENMELRQTLQTSNFKRILSARPAC